MESNVNKWNFWQWNPIRVFSNCKSMDLGNKFLKDCKTVEDWGTGDGLFKFYRKDAVGVDGSNTPGADKKFIDLINYISDCEGIFIRHVFEHNFEWDKILFNSLKSATKKICIVMFIPFSDNDTVENKSSPNGVPNLSISNKKFFKIIEDHNVFY